MRRVIAVCICLAAFVLAGCARESTIKTTPEETGLTAVPEQTELITTSSPDEESNTLSDIVCELTELETANSTVEESCIPSYLIGSWRISYATERDTGEAFPLQHIYGTGIRYGGILRINEDGTFLRFIGIGTNERERYEGTCSVSIDDEITFEFYNGRVSTAVYLSLSQEIEYHLDQAHPHSTLPLITNTT